MREDMGGGRWSRWCCTGGEPKAYLMRDVPSRCEESGGRGGGLRRRDSSHDGRREGGRAAEPVDRGADRRRCSTREVDLSQATRGQNLLSSTLSGLEDGAVVGGAQDQKRRSWSGLNMLRNRRMIRSPALGVSKGEASGSAVEGSGRVDVCFGSRLLNQWTG